MRQRYLLQLSVWMGLFVLSPSTSYAKKCWKICVSTKIKFERKCKKILGKKVCVKVPSAKCKKQKELCLPIKNKVKGSPPHDNNAEKKWLKKLPRLTAQDLQAGDILLKKSFKDSKVRIMQTAYPAFFTSGSNCTSHAILYLGNGMVAEASGEAGKTRIVPLHTDMDVVVWRPKDRQHAASAVSVARWIVGKKVKYSREHCLGSPFHMVNWGPLSKKRHEQITKRQLPHKEMMCSEMVIFSFQGRAQKPLIKLDAKFTPPVVLEDYLYRHQKDFQFLGFLPRK
ncbi:MAG: hypothetical protein H6728_11835 [Myxococcales bacterium]|nr:hypothetical protein [Myxococcales bacterium]